MILWTLPASEQHLNAQKEAQKRKERVTQGSACFAALSGCSAPTCE